jgi:hypothetical protein
MFYYTRYKEMGVPQYVHADVPLGHYFEGMFYHTHDSDMVAPQYVIVDVPSDAPVS